MSAAVASCLKRKLLLILNILCIVFVHDVFELRYQAVRITGFRSVMYGDKLYTETWKNYSNVLTNLNCISAKTGQIFYDKATNTSVLNESKGFLKAGSVKIRTCISIIFYSL